MNRQAASPIRSKHHNDEVIGASLEIVFSLLAVTPNNRYPDAVYDMHVSSGKSIVVGYIQWDKGVLIPAILVQFFSVRTC